MLIRITDDILSYIPFFYETYKIKINILMHHNINTNTNIYIISI